MVHGCAFFILREGGELYRATHREYRLSVPDSSQRAFDHTPSESNPSLSLPFQLSCVQLTVYMLSQIHSQMDDGDEFVNGEGTTTTIQKGLHLLPTLFSSPSSLFSDSDDLFSLAHSTFQLLLPFHHPAYSPLFVGLC
jgi:hypothetical protein